MSETQSHRERQRAVPDRLLIARVRVDVTKSDDHESLAQVALTEFGRVDFWINNAGTTTNPLPLWDVGTDELEQTVMTNLLGTMYGTQVAVRGMQMAINVRVSDFRRRRR